jgi:hypothetical protein
MAMRERAVRGPGAEMGFPTMRRPDLSTRMAAMTGRRRTASLLVGAIVVVALALPAFAADPSASSSAAPPKAAASEPPEPDESPGDEGSRPNKDNKVDKGNKGAETPEVAITLHGTIAMTKDSDGFPSFTIGSGSKTYGLEAGPPWFWGANNPLAKFAGKSVTITGETSAGSTDVDVLTVDGTSIRAPGKPPWAGGWKAVGSKHPGWSQDKADRFKAKFGDCFPPGQCRKADTAPAASPTIPRGD